MFLIDLLFFSIFQLLVVYPLGKSLVNILELKLWWFQDLVFSIILGIFTLTIFVLFIGYTNYNYLPLLIGVSVTLFLLQLKNFSFQKIRQHEKSLTRADIAVILAIVFCVLIQSIIVFPNGITPEGKIVLKGGFIEEATWHISIINNLKESIPPENPIYAGEKLTNYNYFSDVFITTVQRFTRINTLTLYFNLIGPFLSFLCAVSLYFVLKEFTKNKLISALGVLLITLGCTYYYIFGFFRPNLNLNPSSLFGNDYLSRMVNYQLPFSYLLLTSIIFLLLTSKKINSLRFTLTTSILIASGIGFKSYGTLLIVPALYLVGFYKILIRELSYIKIAFFSSIFLVIFVYVFFHRKNPTEEVFTINPFWIIENIFNDPLRLNSPAWATQRDWYVDNNNYLGIVYLYLKGVFLFLFTNLGLKILGFYNIFNEREGRKKEVILLISIIALIGIFMPLVFTQGGVKWNVIQFIWYSGFMLGILLVLFISNLQRRLGLGLTLVIMLVTWGSFLPGVYRYSKYYLLDSDNLTVYNFKGTQESYEAAKFLYSQEDGILLMDSVYSQTSFIVAISRKTAFFADTTILSNLFIDWQSRSKGIDLFFNSPKEDYRKNFLKENNISYVFTASKTSKDLGSKDYLVNIYNNEEVSIYKTKL